MQLQHTYALVQESTRISQSIVERLSTRKDANEDSKEININSSSSH